MTRQGRTTGRTARRKGLAAEAVVAAHHARYAAEGRALIYQRPTPVKPLGGVRGGAFRACWLASAGCDFGGVLTGGVGVVLELKTSAGASLPLARHGEPSLKPAQGAELAQAHALGALALVLVRVSPAAGDVWVRLAWPGWVAAVAEAEAEGAASLSVARLSRHGRVVVGGDWLARMP